MVESPAQSGRLRTLIHPGPISGVHVTFDTPLHRGGRKLAYNTKVQYRCAEAFGCNGNLKVGKAYTAMLDLKPGDEFEIRLGKKQICLVPIRGTEEADEEE
ncbi:MAG: AbrB-like transcriptional regulator [Prochlorococcaceae cyanobacterium]